MITVTVMLKPSARKAINKWECHIYGEKRMVTQQKVMWVATDLKTAYESFKPFDVLAYRIEFNPTKELL